MKKHLLIVLTIVLIMSCMVAVGVVTSSAFARETQNVVDAEAVKSQSDAVCNKGECEDRTSCLKVLSAKYDKESQELTVQVQNTCSESIVMGICYSPTYNGGNCSFAEMRARRIITDTGQSENNRYYIKGAKSGMDTTRCVTTKDGE